MLLRSTGSDEYLLFMAGTMPCSFDWLTFKNADTEIAAYYLSKCAPYPAGCSIFQFEFSIWFKVWYSANFSQCRRLIRKYICCSENALQEFYVSLGKSLRTVDSEPTSSTSFNWMTPIIRPLWRNREEFSYSCTKRFESKFLIMLGCPVHQVLMLCIRWQFMVFLSC